MRPNTPAAAQSGRRWRRSSGEPTEVVPYDIYYKSGHVGSHIRLFTFRRPSIG